MNYPILKKLEISNFSIKEPIKQFFMKKLPLFICGLLLFALLNIFATTNGTPQPKETNSMLNFNNNDDFEKEWKTIDSLERQGLPKSALEKVEKLYTKAKKSRNDAQFIKTIIYKNKYQSQLEENGLENAIKDVEKEMFIASNPVKAILQSILAEMYQQYFNNHQWKIKSRSETNSSFKKEDIQTWSIGDFLKKSSDLYLASVKDKSIQSVPIQKFDVITSTQKNVEDLRPTLYDFLAHRAIDYFRNERSHLTEPAYKFYIDQEEAFEDAKTFAAFNFKTKDLASYKYKALQLFQELLKFRLKEENVGALMSINLKRLGFVHRNATINNKKSLYVNQLKEIIKRYKSHPSSTEAMVKLAEAYMQDVNLYDKHSNNEEHKWHRKKALEICEEGIRKFPNAFGTNRLKQHKSQILNKNLVLNIEDVNPTQQPSLVILGYKNIQKVWLKAVKLTEEDLKIMEDFQGQRNYIEFLNKKEILQTQNHSLEDDGDYLEHSVELKIDPLPLGAYALMVADNPDFGIENNATAYVIGHISNMGFFSRKKEKEQEFIVTNRRTGEPIEGVKTEIFEQKYSSLTRKYNFKKKWEGTTDKDGVVKVSGIGERGNFKARFSKGNDWLEPDRGFNNYYYDRVKKPVKTTQFFLDRAIYRPGQTIYFKGLVIEKDTEAMPSIAANQEITVTFKDANYQDIATQKFRTNEYGTFNGTFIAPTSGLLGQMHLQSSYGNSSKFFRVEEYKRPKFEVKFKQMEEAYKVNDNVTVEGYAKAFAGNNIDGAKVKYRVVRQTSFPYWRWWMWGRISYNTSAQEIANGETTTDENGAFKVSFQALPDKSVSRDKKPQFSYKVYADVVDITGETRSNTTSVNIGYIALNVTVDIGIKINKDSLKSIEISTTNLDGGEEKAQGTITIEQLEMPKNTFVTRYWNKPDKFILSKAEFKKDFPQYAYQDEDETKNWKKVREVFNGKFDTAQEQEVELNTRGWSAGMYKMILKTQDKYGESIEIQKVFTVYDLKAKTYPTLDLLEHIPFKIDCQPNESAIFYLVSGNEKRKLLYELEHDGKIIERKWLTINELEKRTIPIVEKYRGGLYYHLTYAALNRAYSTRHMISVPWKNKDLKIEYSTFRDKLSPGQEEEWRVKITGDKGEKVSAEMLATMYDASLDAFAVNNWTMGLYPYAYSVIRTEDNTYNMGSSRLVYNQWQPDRVKSKNRAYRVLNWFNFPFWGGGYYGGRRDMMAMSAAPESKRSRKKMEKSSAPPPPPPVAAGGALNDTNEDGVVEVLDNEAVVENRPQEQDFSDVKVRTNLNETVFFFPDLMTDKEGNVIIKFKMNEALTKWKFLGMGHTKDLKYGFTKKEIVTQKELMVQPNAPRFVREGDKIEFTAKVSNLTENALSGTAKLLLFDAVTMEPVDIQLGNTQAEIPFTAQGGQSAPLKWNLNIPLGKVNALTHRVVAKAGNFSDGEESTIPILTNRMMVTESLPLPVRGNQTKTFAFNSLKNNNSRTLQHHSYTLEFTSNPAWYAVQALPYLMEYPYDCTEQIFSRYYANSLATHVANEHPKIKRVFDNWKQTDAKALASNLSKNQELKTALLEETPWVMNAQSEEEQKRNIGLLFDLNRMADEQQKAIDKIVERQLSNGGFAWFPGGRDNWYITQYLVEGLGHLDKLGVKEIHSNKKVKKMTTKAVNYIDERIVEQYNELEKLVNEGKAKWEDDHLNSIAIHYLYARTFFLDIEPNRKIQQVMDYYFEQAEKYWLSKGMYGQGMIALALHREAKGDAPKAIVKSLKERSLSNEEMGMYWKYNYGYYWHQLPIETHSLMIEVFDVIAQDEKAVEELKVWLLKNKQTNHWKTTKATSSAVYAMLMRGDNWLLEDKVVDVSIGRKIKTGGTAVAAEAGTGYFKESWKGEEVGKDMGEITVKNPNKAVAWGAVYWQYFEELDKIKDFKETPLTLVKQLFVEEMTDKEPKIRPITTGRKLIPGDKVKVRLELRVDRDMEYVHMKDMRASGFEPMNVLSHYKWQGGLGYYESTKDASTNFFFDFLPKGTYVFEYPLRVQHKGDFSNGITTIQCMYAPEFTSHSEGIRVEVE